jgi:hypothetical protein
VRTPEEAAVSQAPAETPDRETTEAK